jgi:outer membrane protein assembly factor BamB
VFVGSCAGTVTAVDARSGDTLWTFDLTAATGAAEVHGRMLVAGDTLYVPADHADGGHVYAIDTNSGTARWRAATEKAANDGGFSTDLINAFDSLVTITAGHELVSIDYKTGAIRWSQQLGGSGPRRLSADYDRKRIYCTDRSDLVIVNAADGKILGRHPMGAEATTSVTVAERAVYVGLADNRLAAFDADSGKLLRAVTLPHRAVWTPRDMSGTVMVLTLGDELVAADLGLTGILWRRGTPGEWNSPRIERWRNYALAGDDRGIVEALDPATGKVAHTFEVQGTVRGIGVTTDVLYIGTLRGDVFAYATDSVK